MNTFCEMKSARQNQPLRQSYASGVMSLKPRRCVKAEPYFLRQSYTSCDFRDVKYSLRFHGREVPRVTRTSRIPWGGGHFCGRVARPATRQRLLHFFQPSVILSHVLDTASMRIYQLLAPVGNWRFSRNLEMRTTAPNPYARRGLTCHHRPGINFISQNVLVKWFSLFGTHSTAMLTWPCTHARLFERYPMLVLGALCSFMEPFCRHLSPKVLQIFIN